MVFSESSPDFPGGVGDDNLPAKAGDRGPTPGPGSFHTGQSNQACVSQLPSPHAATAEAPGPRACIPQVTTTRVVPTWKQEKASMKQQRPRAVKNK